jgi:hypothetical protein
MGNNDYKDSKDISTNGYPVHANGTSGLLSRVEPLLNPAKLRSRYLKGILERAPKNFTFTDDELKDRINMAVNELELELKCPVFAENFKDKLPFDERLYQSFIHLRPETKPLLSIERLAIVSSNGDNLFQIPSLWIETANFHQGLINVIPLLGAFGTNRVSGSVATGGIVFLSVTRGLGWLPAYWEVQYTAGLCKNAGNVPIVVNNLIGVIAAMDILSVLALANPNTSVSLGQDGISQSSTNPGVNIYVTRLSELEKKKATLLGQLKRVFGNKMFLSNI